MASAVVAIAPMYVPPAEPSGPRLSAQSAAADASRPTRAPPLPRSFAFSALSGKIALTPPARIRSTSSRLSPGTTAAPGRQRRDDGADDVDPVAAGEPAEGVVLGHELAPGGGEVGRRSSDPPVEPARSPPCTPRHRRARDGRWPCASALAIARGAGALRGSCHQCGSSPRQPDRVAHVHHAPRRLRPSIRSSSHRRPRRPTDHHVRRSAAPPSLRAGLVVVRVGVRRRICVDRRARRRRRARCRRPGRRRDHRRPGPPRRAVVSSLAAAGGEGDDSREQDPGKGSAPCEHTDTHSHFHLSALLSAPWRQHHALERPRAPRASRVRGTAPAAPARRSSHCSPRAGLLPERAGDTRQAPGP